jgi:hypothetical protein
VDDSIRSVDDSIRSVDGLYALNKYFFMRRRFYDS